jgi:2-amino-4-hydroxy-6-hydroxymethyldihydropteridine diphosphokinase
MARCLISFGANIGDAWGTIQAAASRLQEQLCAAVNSAHEEANPFQLSRCFRTPPVGGPMGQPPFINAVAAIYTAASPWDVWHCIRNVEKEFGRERNLRWEARRIDLDILLYDDVRIWTPHLKIPHPRMCMRRFILLPAVDVARDWLDPVSGWTVGQLAENVRSGPSNFVLLGDETGKAESLLAEVARRTGARWRSGKTSPVATEHLTSGRWVATQTTSAAHLGTTKFEDICSAFTACKLVIALAPQVPSTDVAWEDYHHQLACKFGMVANEGVVKFGLGPRYLLASHDPDWAIQELTAALEAMDCPIEAL